MDTLMQWVAPRSGLSDAAIRRRIEDMVSRVRDFTIPIDTSQIDALALSIHAETREAYRLAIQREAAKLGIFAYGPLDPFTDVMLQAAAHTSARQVTDTYLRRYQNAAKRGDDLQTWHEEYATQRGTLIWSYEYSRADATAVRAFYGQNDLQGTAHVAPEDAVCEICQGLVALGEMPLADAMQLDVPAHQNCDHYVEVSPIPPVEDSNGASPGGDVADSGATGAGPADVAGASLTMSDLLLIIWTAGLAVTTNPDDVPDDETDTESDA